MKQVRLLPFGTYDPAYNMALDALLLRRVGNGQSPPTFRFYGWNQPTLSFGRSQESVLFDLDARLDSRDFALIQRPTGGAVAVHGRDLSYSIIAPFPGDLLPNRPKACYEAIHKALARALRQLGCDVVCVPEKRGDYRREIYCGLTLNACDIVYAGRKVVGSAQRLASQAVLQHGFVLLDEDFAWLRQQLGAKANTIAAACCSMAELLPDRNLPDGDRIRRTILDALGDALGVVFEPADLDAEEKKLME